MWQRADASPGLAECGPPPAGPPFDTVEFHLNEALTNLYVGLHRELRGERLAAARFIQVYAVDRVIALLNLSSSEPSHRRDPFDASRRVERAYRQRVLPLAAMMPGYECNRDAAQATLAWLQERYAADPVIVDAIRDLMPGDIGPTAKGRGSDGITVRTDEDLAGHVVGSRRTSW